MWSQDYKLVFRSLPQLSRRLSCSILRTCLELLPSIEKSKSTIVVLPLNPFCTEGIIQRWKKWAANFFACFGSLKHFTLCLNWNSARFGTNIFRLSFCCFGFGSQIYLRLCYYVSWHGSSLGGHHCHVSSYIWTGGLLWYISLLLKHFWQTDNNVDCRPGTILDL